MTTTTLWMLPDASIHPPYIVYFRNHFSISSSGQLHFRFSADERAMIFLDGQRIAEGPERSCSGHWHYGEVEVAVSPGEHTLTARLLVLGQELTAYAQMSVAPGFYVHEDGQLLSPNWQYQMQDCQFTAPEPDWGIYARVCGGENCNLQAYCGSGGDWQPVIWAEDSRQLYPPQLPPMKYLPETVFRQKDGVFHFSEYALRWGVYHFAGPGRVKIRHLEGSYASAADLPPADDNKNWDILPLPNGEVIWHDYWFRSGQTSEVRLEGDARLLSVEFFRTGYPHRYKVDFTNPDPKLERLLTVSRRTFECCTFETYMDCPFYEQLMYIGDTRVQALVTFAICEDWQLPRKALRTLAEGIDEAGNMQNRYPGKEIAIRPLWGQPIAQVQVFIPSFSLFFLSMVHDYARLHDDDCLVRELLLKLRALVANILRHLTADGLLRMPGWNFIDWLPNWKAGVTPGGRQGGGCVLNLIAVMALRDYADLEQHFGDLALAQEVSAVADALAAKIRAVFWAPERGAFAEDESQTYFSEHAQVFAMLVYDAPELADVLRAAQLDQCGIYFSFYYIVVCRKYGLQDLLNKRRQKYLELSEAGLSCMPEEFANWRSYCHAWSAHWLYHTYAQDSFLERIH